MSLTIQSPISGAVVTLSDVPDPVFSGKITSPGMAITPSTADGGRVGALAPISGTITKIHLHAYVITGDDGHSVPVHLGLDTVSLGGKGLILLTSEGDTIGAGNLVVRWSPAQTGVGGLNPIILIIILEGDETDLEPVPPGRITAAGDMFMTWA